MLTVLVDLQDKLASNLLRHGLLRRRLLINIRVFFNPTNQKTFLQCFYSVEKFNSQIDGHFYLSDERPLTAKQYLKSLQVLIKLCILKCILFNMIHMIDIEIVDFIVNL